MRHKRQGSAAATGISIIALIISLIAIGMTWYFYTQPTPGSQVDVEQEVARQLEELRQESQFTVALSQARSQLGVIKAGIELIEEREGQTDTTTTDDQRLSAETFYPRAAEELNTIEQNLENAYDNADDPAVEWDTLEEQFDQLRNELDDQNANQAIQVIDSLRSLLSTTAPTTS